MSDKRGNQSVGATLALILGALLLVGTIPATADEQPSEQQLLDALKRHRLTRCPISGCGTAPPEAAVGTPGIAIEIPFDYGSSIPGSTARAALAALADALRRPDLKGTALVIAGHTDGTGSAAFNQRLSERRAQSVKLILMRDLGIPGATLTAIGYGKTKLKNLADAFASENRRVEITTRLPSKGGEVQGKHPGPRPLARDSSVFEAPSGSCRAWTDGCRICSRAQDGEVTCSNIGISCQLGKVVCTQDDPSRKAN